MLFSQRKGLKPIKNIIQVDSMDAELRSALWNAFHVSILQNNKYAYNSGHKMPDSNLYPLFCQYWHSYFKIPLDMISPYFDEASKYVRNYFFNCKWHEAYDFIEFTSQNCSSEFGEAFDSICNAVLEREVSGYRLVDHKITEITSEEEISAIEKAIQNTDKYAGAQQHLKTALCYLSDRKAPDYRNSIKESISAVESICKIISGEPKVTLGQALVVLEKNQKIHGALKTAFSALYGYTSDESGIRHALIEESTLSGAEAKFMLTSCAAFVNYIIAKI